VCISYISSLQEKKAKKRVEKEREVKEDKKKVLFFNNFKV